MTDEKELHAGVPLQKPRTFTNAGVGSQDEVTGQTTGRNLGDEELAGVPNQRPIHGRKVEALVDPVLEEFEDTASEFEEENSDGFSLGKLLSSPVISAAILFAATGILIVILSEFFQFVQAVQASPFIMQVIAYVCIGLLAIVFCIALIRLALVYRLLSVTPKVDLGAIRQTKRRAATRDQIHRQVEAGYKSLRAIVETYPISDKKHKSLLVRCGMNRDEINTFNSNIESLLGSENAGQSRWIEDCERLFVSVIDRTAKRRVTSYAKRVAVKTAISPTGFVDSLIVATNAVLMVEDLCRLYGVRTGRWQSVLLTWRIFFSTFVSAKLEERIDELADSLFEGALSSIPQISKELFARLSLGLLKRAAEGSVNMALFYRLGTATVVALRPISLSVKGEGQ
ncbi:MAG: DUF697 domain-containing protein [bacterium]|nr:DUF697 domain-containing protein [bacterium]